MCNTHAASLGDVTWTPHLCNTQYVKTGINGYISDTLSTIVLSIMGTSDRKYYLGRDETLRRTNMIRDTKIDKVICYTDYGVSSGMREAINVAENNPNVDIIYRSLPNDLKKEIFGESFLSTFVPLAKTGSILGLATYGAMKLLRRGR